MPIGALTPSPNAVSTTPGMTMVRLSPLSSISPFTDSLKPTIPNFVAAYVAPPGSPALPSVEETFTMWPRPRGVIRRIASRVPWITP